MSFCSKCGKELKPEALFCDGCGTAIGGGGGGGAKVSNTWIWMLLVVCAVGNILKAFNDAEMFLYVMIVSGVLNLILWLIDLRELRAKGHEGLWGLWGLFAIPIYLFVRAARVTKEYTVAIGYAILFIMLISVNLGTGEIGNAVSNIFDGVGGGAFDDLVESKYVTMVKNGSLEACPDHTVNEMVQSFLGTPKWEHGVAADGSNFVNIRGRFSYDGKDVNGAIQFIVDDNSFRFNAFEINDLPQNMFLAMSLMQKMCSAASESGGGTTGKTESYINQENQQVSASTNRTLDSRLVNAPGKEWVFGGEAEGVLITYIFKSDGKFTSTYYGFGSGDGFKTDGTCYTEGNRLFCSFTENNYEGTITQGNSTDVYTINNNKMLRIGDKLFKEEINCIEWGGCE